MTAIELAGTDKQQHMAGSAAAGSSSGKILLKCTVWEVLATAPRSRGLAQSGPWCMGMTRLGLDGPL